jgi:hypothetical protein
VIIELVDYKKNKHAPCTDGCSYKFNQFGTPSENTDYFSTTAQLENFFKECALRLIKEFRPK